MDLRSGTLYWPAVTPRRAVAARSPRRLGVDALVIGAGITGALAAYTLTKAGASVAIVDRRRPVNASTPASTALLQYDLDKPLIELAKVRGVRGANAVYRASMGAVREMGELCEELGEDVELRARESLYLAKDVADAAMLRREAMARAKIGIECTYLDASELLARFGLARPGAILSALAFEANPVKLTRLLLARAVEGGAMLLEPHELDLAGLVRDERPFRVAYSSNMAITASHVVIATGYETPEQFALVRELVELRSTYAIATKAVAGEPWPRRALLWDTGDPYFYARTTCDGRVLMGGLDDHEIDAALRDAKIVAKSKRLLARLNGMLPGKRVAMEFAWAGTFAQTSDACPLIGEHSKLPRVHFALGYGGNGITFSLLAAKIITGAITGNEHESARLFRMERGG